MSEPKGPDEASGRAYIAASFRDAAVKKWGPSFLEKIKPHLSDDAWRRVAVERIPAFSWMPERLQVEWLRAIWIGCHRDERQFRDWVAQSTAIGYGVFRRVTFAALPPSMIVSRAPVLWREAHTHGDLSIVMPTEHAMQVKLKDESWCASHETRLRIAEFFRCLVGMMRGVRDCKETHHATVRHEVDISLTWS